MPLRKKWTASWTPNGAGRRFHSASGTEKYNPSARFAGTSFYTREVLAGRFTEPCALLFALNARKPRARNARPYGDGTSPSYVGSLDPAQNGESPSPNPRPRRRGLRGNMVPFPAALCAAGTPNGMDSGRSIPGAPAVLRGTGRAGKSRAARDAVPHCISAEMPRLSPWRVLSWTAPAARSLCSPLRAAQWGPLLIE